MVETLEDVKRVAEIADRLRELGIPKKTCGAIDKWNKRREEKINSHNRVQGQPRIIKGVGD